jgi:histidine triad (HIT) family protein
MMELDGVYDEGNIFARILRDEISSVRIWEDERALAFMDAFPQARGHSLVIPRMPVRNLLDTPPSMLAHLIEVTQRVARASVAALGCEGVRVMQFNGAAAGQSVPHLHFHIVPMGAGQALAKHGAGQADAADLRDIAAKIRLNLQ